MLTLRQGIRIFWCTKPVDMRKAIDGLSIILADQFSLPPQSGDVYVFSDRSYRKIKCLLWDRNGFVIYYKRLEMGRFYVKYNDDGDRVELTADQLKWLLAGLDFRHLNVFPEISDYF